MNPYELSDKNEEKLPRRMAIIRQSAYLEGYAEGYKDGLARFVPEVDSVPIPKVINIPRNSPNMTERALLNTAKELEAAESEIRYYRGALKDAVSIIGELMGYDNWLAYPPYLAERVEEFIAPFDAEGV